MRYVNLYSANATAARVPLKSDSRNILSFLSGPLLSPHLLTRKWVTQFFFSSSIFRGRDCAFVLALVLRITPLSSLQVSRELVVLLIGKAPLPAFASPSAGKSRQLVIIIVVVGVVAVLRMSKRQVVSHAERNIGQ